MLFRSGYCFVGLDEAGRPGFPVARTRLRVEPADWIVKEGQRFRIRIGLDRAVGRTTWIRLRLAGQTASIRKDLVPPAVRVRIPAGRMSAVIAVKVRRDDLVEGPESLTVSLSGGQGLLPDDSTATIVIEDRGR